LLRSAVGSSIAEAPAIIAAAVHAGHRYATELDTMVDNDEPLRHDRPVVAAVMDASHVVTTTKDDAVAADCPVRLQRSCEEESNG